MPNEGSESDFRRVSYGIFDENFCSDELHEVEDGSGALMSWPQRKGDDGGGWSSLFFLFDLWSLDEKHEKNANQGMICRAGRAIGARRLQGRQGVCASGIQP